MQKRERYLKEFNLKFKESDILIKNKHLAEFFENVVSEVKYEKDKVKIVYNLLVNDMLGLLMKYNKNFEDIKIAPSDFAELINEYFENKINIKIVKDILEKVVLENKEIRVLLKDKKIILDQGVIEKTVEEAILENPKAIEDFKKGKKEAIQFLIGYIMKKTKGQADINLTKEILIKKLENA